MTYAHRYFSRKETYQDEYGRLCCTSVPDGLLPEIWSPEDQIKNGCPVPKGENLRRDKTVFLGDGFVWVPMGSAKRGYNPSWFVRVGL